jgi:mycoredoxin
MDDVQPTNGDSNGNGGTDGEIVVFWRPGCGFCVALLRQLDRHEVPHRLVNIWEEPEGAAFVRTVANGNETVPTVAVGPVALVNPRVAEVLEVAHEHAPSAVPDGYEAPTPGRVGGWITRALGG